MNSKRIIPVSICLILIGFGLWRSGIFSIAEQSGSSPESGVTSRIKTISNDLTSKGFGGTASGG